MLDKPPPRWVLDASVVINLLAMPDPKDLVARLGLPCLVPQQVADEVRRLDHPSRSSQDPASEVRRIFEVTTLSGPEWDLFGDLVGAAAPDDLDDGEAAALAVAAIRGGACLVDDQKCIRIAASQRPQVETRTTLDLLRWTSRNGLRQQDIAASVEDAIRYARMRVPPAHTNWVHELIGRERFLELRSLPAGSAGSVRTRGKESTRRRSVARPRRP